MGKRRKSREFALQVLYQQSITKQDAALILNQIRGRFLHEEADDAFAEEIVRGVIGQANVLDEVIGRYSEHWRLDRMSLIDRNILRIATFELLFRDDIPPKVTINEAIDLGKRFGSEDSGGFINGLLDRIRKDVAQRVNEGP